MLDGTDVTLVGAGITLHEALAAAERLAGEGISARVIDLYSVKPIDHETLVKAAQETGAIVTVEDHWKEGGIGEAVLAALAEHGAERRGPHPRGRGPADLGQAGRAAARRRDRRRGDLRRGDRDRQDQGRDQLLAQAGKSPSRGTNGSSSPSTKMSTATSGSTWMLLMWASTRRPRTSSMRSL